LTISASISWPWCSSWFAKYSASSIESRRGGVAEHERSVGRRRQRLDRRRGRETRFHALEHAGRRDDVVDGLDPTTRATVRRNVCTATLATSNARVGIISMRKMRLSSRRSAGEARQEVEARAGSAACR
jgi:hypothetical protein